MRPGESERRSRRGLLIVLAGIGIALVGATLAALEWRERQKVLASRFDSSAYVVSGCFAPAEALLAAVTTATAAEARAGIDDARKELVVLADLLSQLQQPQTERSRELRRLEDRARVLSEAVAEDERCQKIFMDAVTIVQERTLPKYGEARTALDGIPPASRFYLDAQTYKHWLVADTKVREAASLARKGDRVGARRLYLSALENEALGPEARESVRKRLAALDAPDDPK